MRIISGKYKGRAIEAPKGIRPTQDNVRKALFDILGDIEGLSFIDLYAGSGAVGLEALSCGAKSALFVEEDRQAVKVIQANLNSLKSQVSGFRATIYHETCDMRYETIIINKDVFEAIPLFFNNKQKFDVIFLDPPYYKGKAPRLRSGLTKEEGESLTKKTLQILGAYDILSGYGLVVAQHFKKDKLPETAENLTLVKQASYGDTLLSIYNKEQC